MWYNKINSREPALSLNSTRGFSFPRLSQSRKSSGWTWQSSCAALATPVTSGGSCPWSLAAASRCCRPPSWTVLTWILMLSRLCCFMDRCCPRCREVASSWWSCDPYLHSSGSHSWTASVGIEYAAATVPTTTSWMPHQGGLCRMPCESSVEEEWPISKNVPEVTRPFVKFFLLFAYSMIHGATRFTIVAKHIMSAHGDKRKKSWHQKRGRGTDITRDTKQRTLYNRLQAKQIALGQNETENRELGNNSNRL